MGFSPKSRKRKTNLKKDPELDENEAFDFNHDIDYDTDPRVSSKQLDREVTKKIDYSVLRKFINQQRAFINDFLVSCLS